MSSFQTDSAKIRQVKISPPKFVRPYTRVPIRIQLNGGGTIPFGCDVDKFGKMQINISLSPEDALHMKSIDEYFLKTALANKDAWWPDKKNGVKDYHVQDNYTPILYEPRVEPGSNQNDTPSYPPRIRMKVPISMTTGEPVAVRIRQNQRVCEIRDHDGSIVSVHDLRGRAWDSCIIAMHCIYLTGKYSFSVSRSLEKIKLAYDPEAEAEYQVVDFL